MKTLLARPSPRLRAITGWHWNHRRPPALLERRAPATHPLPARKTPKNRETNAPSSRARM